MPYSECYKRLLALGWAAESAHAALEGLDCDDRASLVIFYEEDDRLPSESSWAT